MVTNLDDLDDCDGASYLKKSAVGMKQRLFSVTNEVPPFGPTLRFHQETKIS